MFQIINILSKKTSITRDEFQTLTKDINLNDLINFKISKNGDCLILKAARDGNLNLLKIVKQTYPNLNFSVTNHDGKNALHESCQNSDYDCVRFLVDECKIDVNSLRKGDWTPLMLACTKNNLEIIKFLIERNARIDQTNKDKWNAFMIAVREGNVEIIKYFLSLDKTLVVRTRSSNGRTPCHTACLHGNLQILKLMLEKNEENKNQILTARDSCGSTPLMEAVIADHVDIVKYLLKYECIDIFDRDNLSNSCLHLSAQSGSLEVFHFLFDIFFKKVKNSDLIENFSALKNFYSMTPLQSAVKNGKSSVVNLIFEKLCGEQCFSEFVDLTIKNKMAALINQKDCHGRSAYDMALSSKYEKILDFFEKFL